MAKLEYYKSFFSYKSVAEINKDFIATILPTNRTYEFFVDWTKIRANVQKFKIEIGILGTLVNSKNFEKDLRAILLDYPKTVKVLPLLIAVRDKEFEILEDSVKLSMYKFNSEDKLTETNVNGIINFVKRSGIAELFKSIKVLNDYLWGVEVGLDSNARKNRSGNFMEKIVGDSLAEIGKAIKDLEIFPKNNFGNLKVKYNISIPRGLQERTPDFSLNKNGKLISIEVNFYQGQGSKPQEIVDAYLNRQRELKDAGWNFIWITDGGGWIRGQNQIFKAIEQMDFVLNLSFVKRGFLKYIIDKS